MKRFIFCTLVALISISRDMSLDDPLFNESMIPVSLSAVTPEFDSQTPESKSGRLLVYQPESWNDSETVSTRTYAEIDTASPSEYFQYWSSGDAISLFLTTANLKYSLQYYKDSKDVGFFELDDELVVGNELTTDYFYSVYPYKESTEISKKGKITYNFPSTQHYSDDSYANGENGMISIIPKSEWQSDGENVLYFKNFCSYLQIRLFNNEGKSKSVRKITLVTNDSENKIAGDATIELGDMNSAPIVEIKRKGSANQITLDCGNGVELSRDENNPSKFWFVLPGSFNFKSGFSITVLFTDNTYYKQSTYKTIQIDRNHIKPMATLEAVSKQASGPIRYRYNNQDIQTRYPLTSTFYDANGVPLDVIDQVYNESNGEWTVLLSGELKKIGGNSFKDTSNDLEYIKVDNDDKSIEIDDFAFYNCTADKIEIFNDVESIGESAFTGSTIDDLIIHGKVTTIKNSAGTGSNIVNIDIEQVVTIEEQAFSACLNLQTLNLGNVESIGYRAFYMCSNLNDVHIPGVKNIYMGAFRSCKSLTTIVLDSVVNIDDNAFMDCSSLTSVIISANCIMIGEGAFCNATSLKEVYCYAEKPPFIKTDNYDCSYAFDNVHPDICIYIPKGSFDYYIDDEYFEGQILTDPNIEAEVNWWYEEYEDYLVEIDTSN